MTNNLVGAWRDGVQGSVKGTEALEGLLKDFPDLCPEESTDSVNCL
jgi:hypothetical protein